MTFVTRSSSIDQRGDESTSRHRMSTEAAAASLAVGLQSEWKVAPTDSGSSRNCKSEPSESEEFGAGPDPVDPESWNDKSAKTLQDANGADEGIQRWVLAELRDKGEYSYWGMQPLENTPFQEAVAIVTMLAVFGWVYVGPVVVMTTLVGLICYRSTVAALVAATLLFAAFAPASPDWGPWGRNYIWQTWRRYFRFRWVTPHPPFLAADRHFLFLHFPHGAFPLGSWLSMALTGSERLRHLFVWMGCTPASRSNLIHLLHHRSVGILPEGVAGVFRGARREREQAYFSPRKGICKIALRTGTHIVPVYILGQSQVFTYRGFERLSRRLKTAVGLFWGRWFLPLPHKTDMVMAIGNSIAVPKVEEPTHEQVEALHAEVEEAVQELYHRHSWLLPALDGKDLKIV